MSAFDEFARKMARFDLLPDSAGVDVDTAGAILGRSKSSTWRDIKAGRLQTFSVGKSRRVLVGSIRKLTAGG
jgi:hypothetical protein